MRLRRTLLLLLVLATTGSGQEPVAPADAAPRRPSFVVILADDLGYGDLSAYGGPVATPAIDSLGRDGTRFTDFYAASAVCSPSRAALLTGCYPPRVGMSTKLPPSGMEKVQETGFADGLNPDETTLAEVLQQAGYRTALIGKWHLGDRPEFLPTRQGFEQYFGLPYSNNMRSGRSDAYPPLPLMRGEEVIETEPDQDRLTGRYTDEALQFLAAKDDRPFFLLLSHSMPHRPIHVAPEYTQGVSEEQWRSVSEDHAESRDFLYPYALRELDASTGRVLKALDDLGLSEHTLVLFTSDNGPQVGRATPLRGGKAAILEGGFRVPCLLRAPGLAPAGRVGRELWSTLDLLPTFARLAGARLPDVRIDGRDATAIVRGEPDGETVNDCFYYFHARKGLLGIRQGSFKLHLAERTRAADDWRAEALYVLSSDPGETHDVADLHPDVTRQLIEKARAFDAAIESEQRPLGRAPLPVDR